MKLRRLEVKFLFCIKLSNKFPHSTMCPLCHILGGQRVPCQTLIHVCFVSQGAMGEDITIHGVPPLMASRLHQYVSIDW